MTNVDKAESIGILEDLLENNTEEEINAMKPKQFLDAWLEWEGVINYTNQIMEIIDLFYERKED